MQPDRFRYGGSQVPLLAVKSSGGVLNQRVSVSTATMGGIYRNPNYAGPNLERL